MDELTQILSHEEKNSNIIEEKRKKVARELQDKEKKIVKMLETEPGLTAEENKKILIEKEIELKKIEKEKKKELDLKMSKLNEDKERKIALTVDYIIKNSFQN